MSQRTSTSTGTFPIEGGPITVIAGLALLINVVGLFTFTGVALCAFGYIALTLFLSARAGRAIHNSGVADVGTALLVFSWLVALVGGVLVGAFHWLQYAHAAYAVLGVYAAASLIWLAGKAYKGWWQVLFPAVGVAMLIAVAQLGSPPGADDMEKKESWTPVSVAAVDEEGWPIEGATVYLDLEQFWNGDPALDGDRPYWSKDKTEKDGIAKMALHADPRFKRLVIRVRREPFAGGYNEPGTIGEWSGYEDARLQTTLPAPKVPYSFKFVMPRRPHNDSALLAVELKTPDTSASSISRSLKLVLSPEPQLPWREGSRILDENAVASTGRLRDIYLSGSQSFVYKLDHNLAARPLTLYVVEREWSNNNEAYNVLHQVSIDSIPLGGERTLPAIELPGRTSDGRTPISAEGTSETIRR